MIERAIDAGGWALLHSLWQIAAVTSLLPLFLRRLPSSAHERRYLYACVALLLALVVPLAGFAGALLRPPAAEPPGGTSFAGTLPAGLQGPSGALPGGAAWSDGVAPTVPWLPVLWFGGVCALAGRWAGGAWRLRLLLRRRSRPAPRSWRPRIAELARRAGVSRDVPVRITEAVSAPVLVGTLRPAILLPAQAIDGLPDRFVEAALLHELMHVRRRDPWTHRAQLAVRNLLFFHPCVWWLSDRVGIEREHACDDAVVSLTRDPLGYARALACLESRRGELPSPALPSNGGSLMKRIEKIVSNRPQTPPGRGRIAAGVAGLLALALVAAALWATPEIAAGDDASISWMPESVKRWEPQLERAAAKHGVDASLLAVMVLLESRGNPAAESAWGALGLLQVMPRTGERIAEARGIDGFQVEQLRDPETNLDFGAWYLARQMQTFGRLAPGDEAVRLAAAAYNGGPGHLRAHLEEGAPLREETRRYADLVRNLWNDRDAAESATFEATFDGGGY